jgi:ubiquinone/menaquinone biosynthesis C-methylase UbiE
MPALRRWLRWHLVLCLVLVAAPARGQPTDDDARGNRPRAYKGRVIAPVMGYEGADWLERQDRDQTEQPEKVLDALRIRPGSTVADIGAGTGYFSLRIARRVGSKGRVLATDIQPEMLRLLGQGARKAGLDNIELIQPTPADAKLPTNKVDLALMVDVYHELSDPERTIRQVRKALQPDGRLVLVEYRGEDPRVPIKPEHKMTLRQVRYEIEPMGFRLADLFEFLVHQHVIVFVKNDAPDAPDFPAVRIAGATPPAADDLGNAGFDALFNGSDFRGWQEPGPEWRVAEESIIATADADRPARGLRTTHDFADFELDFQLRSEEPTGIAAVALRDFPVQINPPHGVELVIGGPEVLSMHRIGRMRRRLARSELAPALVVPGEWNRYTVRWQGTRLAVAVNGFGVIDLERPGNQERGHIVLLPRAGTVEFRELWIKRLVQEAEKN